MIIYKMQRLGTIYGGWDIPKECELNENSIVFSGGVGEDISFDLILQSMYKCKIFLIDPTIKSLKHFFECKDFFKEKINFTGNIQKDYLDKIKDVNPDFEKFIYINKGLWYKKDELKFFKQTNPDYVSQSLIPNMFGNNYDIVQVDSVKNIMNEYNINKIDLFKLDIEGSEIEVLEQMLNDKIYPRYLCIEFDLYIKGKDKEDKTQKLIRRLESLGYKILKNDDYNITFQKN